MKDVSSFANTEQNSTNGNTENQVADNAVNQVMLAVTPEKLDKLGLNANDYTNIIGATSELKEFTNESVSNFGKKLSQTAAVNADELLSKVNGNELGKIGENILGVVKVAQNLKHNKLTDNSTGLKATAIGKFFGRLVGRKDDAMLSYKDVNTQLKIMVDAIEEDANSLALSSKHLNETINYNYVQIKQLSIYIAAGEINLGNMKKRMAELDELNQNDSMVAMEKFNLNQAIIAMDKRIHDFGVLQFALNQQIPMIDIIARNNTEIINKFNEVKIITLPILKGNLVMQVSLHDQMQSVGVVNSLREATSRIIVENAEKTKHATIEVAKANQNSAIDVEALIQAQNTFQETWEDLSRVQREGLENQRLAQKNLEEQNVKLKQAQISSVSSYNQIQ